MDDATLEGLYRTHGWHVYRRSLRLLGDEEAAEDVCQDVFVRLLRGGPAFRDGTHARAWVFRTTTNLCIDRLRGRRRHDPAPLARLAARTDVEGDADRRLQVLRLLDHLPARDRALAVLRHVDGCTMEELETICGATRKTLSKRLARIEARARRALGGPPPGPPGPPTPEGPTP